MAGETTVHAAVPGSNYYLGLMWKLTLTGMMESTMYYIIFVFLTGPVY